jgi:histidinol-phosphate aminotransferase
MSRFLSGRLAALESYVPGEQPRDMKYIKLNTNESPYPPSPLVLERVSSAEVGKLNLYPDPEAAALRQRLAGRYGLSPDQVFVSNGSDEILSFSFMAFCDQEHGAAFPDITYGFYPVYGQLYGIDCLEIPLREDFTLNPADYHGLNRMIVIANPNAPTGLTISAEDIRGILASNPDNVVLIDEAYVDFGGESVYPLIREYNNLLVVQTFSKSRSMAGARLGFAFGSPALIADLNQIKYSTNPYNLNRLTLAAGEAAIDSDRYFMDNSKKIIAAREYTTSALRRLGFTVTDSKANFVFAGSNQIDGNTLYLELKKRGILIRHFSKARISNYNRITIGTMEQMEMLIQAITDILQDKGKLIR